MLLFQSFQRTRPTSLDEILANPAWSDLELEYWIADYFDEFWKDTPGESLEVDDEYDASELEFGPEDDENRVLNIRELAEDLGCTERELLKAAGHLQFFGKKVAVGGLNIVCTALDVQDLADTLADQYGYSFYL